MKELAFVDVVSYNTMLKSNLQPGKLDEASKLLGQLLDPSEVLDLQLPHCRWS